MPAPRVLRHAAAFQKTLESARRQGKKVGFVPTMGALHPGHLSLVQRARKECGLVAVSIFVNPTQFGPKEDYTRYPRTLRQDLRLLSTAGPVLVFAPAAGEVYPEGGAASVSLQGPLVEHWEGASRPGHFNGVATVVAKLFGLVGPCRAYFGLKDYQQVCVVRRLVADLFLPVQTVACPTVRESDGLALSSRNRYLSPAERKSAPLLHQALQAAKARIRAGERKASVVRRSVLQVLERERRFRLDYFAVADPDTLAPLEKIPGRVWLGIAARLGNTRLIDNLSVEKN
jgi:pantoate--beta-alanine ligase